MPVDYPCAVDFPVRHRRENFRQFVAKLAHGEQYFVLACPCGFRVGFGLFGFTFCGFTLVSLAACITLQHYFNLGHMLWLTGWGFVFGIFVQRLNLSLPSILMGILVLASAGILLALNLLLEYKSINFPLIIVHVCAITLLLKTARLPHLLIAPFDFLNGCLLEIYLLHAYLFVKPFECAFLNFAISLVCIISISLLLAFVANKIRIWIKHF